ncbi:hypothetical protein DSO57_1014273 [Entomophthora muscae]|uniref:Uncharacterized protein n=1 Tax=Entomophthora muscae TaxID=34485 RepID=A0ACC2RK73_9FUNG|nr:hypothetical protein DSO57_1014273 [Entomophthora muscae]
MVANKDKVGSMDYAESGHANGSSVLATYFNVVCVTAGVGILSLPKSVSRAGWWSIPLLILTGVLSIFSSLLLIECKYARSDERLDSFPEIGEAAFGKVGRYVIQTFHYLVLLGSGCLLILVIGLVGKGLVSDLGGEWDQIYFVLLGGLLIAIPLCILKKIKEFVWMAIFGFLTTLATLVIVCGLSIYLIPSLPAPVTTPIKYDQLAPVCAVFALAYAGNMVHPHLEGAMKEPKKWPLALSLGLGTVLVFYLAMAVTGYAIFGESSKAFLFDNISGKGVDAFNCFARVLIIGHVLMAAPLILCSFATEAEPLLKITPQHLGETKATIIRVVFRAAIVFSLTMIAAFLPFPVELMSIIGSLFMAINLYFVPVICHLKLFGLRKRNIIQWVLIAVTIVVALITFSYGSYESIGDLVKEIKAKQN